MRAALVLLGLAGLLLQPAPPTLRRVVFFDDFSGPGLDRSRWTPVVTGGTVNNEQQAYVDAPDVSRSSRATREGASNGALAIRPRYVQAS